MAYQHTFASTAAPATDLPHRLYSGIRSVLSVIASAMVAHSSANRRLQLVERLNAKSDAELAQLGIRREDIVRRVFIDMTDV